MQDKLTRPRSQAIESATSPFGMIRAGSKQESWTSRLREEQIIAILKESRPGWRRENGAGDTGSHGRVYRWKDKFGGLELSEAKRLRQLEDENRRLKHIAVEQAEAIRALKAAEKRGEPAGDEAGWCEMS